MAGFALTMIGLFGIAGSITGSLAAMLAGLFCNNNGVNTALQTTGVTASGAKASPPLIPTPGGGISTPLNPLGLKL